jgi:hypothetical protein
VKKPLRSAEKTSEVKGRYPQGKRRWFTKLSLLFLVAITIGCIAPFASKAFHIDDPLFLWAAKHIQSHPTDPYRFKVTWYYNEMEMSAVTKNPPLTSYYIALVAYLVGWGEEALHLAFLIPAIAAVLGTYSIAQRLCKRPVLASLIGLITPVFLVSSTNIMSDIMMLAFWVWAIVLWIRGMERNDHLLLAVSGFLIAICALTKYYGMSLLILLPVYGFAKNRKIGSWLIYLTIPIVILILYQWKTHALYGRGLLLDAGSYATEFRGWFDFGLVTQSLIGLAFAGGCLATLPFYLPVLWPKRVLLLQLGVLVAVILAISSAEMIGIFRLRNYYGVKWSQVIQLGIMAMVGMNLIALAAADLWNRKGDAASLLLFCWIMGTFTFASFINWSVNARSILPMVPAAGILLVRRIEQRALSFRRPLTLFWPLIPAVFVALGVTWADYGLANSARSAVEKIYATYIKEQRPLRYQGHWGFQYYMALRGAKIAEYPAVHLATEDLLIVPENNCFTFPVSPDNMVRLRETIELFSACRWLTTMNRLGGAGFYADIWGPLPFVVGSEFPERYHVLQIEPARTIKESPSVIDKNKEEYDKAIARYTQALFINLRDAKTFFNRGNVFLKIGEYDKAISDYTQTLIIYPYYLEVYYNRGNAYFSKREYHQAISDYTQVLRMNPRDFKTYLMRGTGYMMNKEYDRAIFDLDQAVRINPNDVKAYHHRAITYLRKREYDKAWEDVKRVKSLGSDIDPGFLEELRKSSGRER